MENELTITEHDDITILKLNFPLCLDECGPLATLVFKRPNPILTGYFCLYFGGDGVIRGIGIIPIQFNTFANEGLDGRRAFFSVPCNGFEFKGFACIRVSPRVDSCIMLRRNFMDLFPCILALIFRVKIFTTVRAMMHAVAERIPTFGATLVISICGSWISKNLLLRDSTSQYFFVLKSTMGGGLMGYVGFKWRIAFLAFLKVVGILPTTIHAPHSSFALSIIILREAQCGYLSIKEVWAN